MSLLATFRRQTNALSELGLHLDFRAVCRSAWCSAIQSSRHEEAVNNVKLWH
jgi:hypothetical protein